MMEDRSGWGLYAEHLLDGGGVERIQLKGLSHGTGENFKGKAEYRRV